MGGFLAHILIGSFHPQLLQSEPHSTAAVNAPPSSEETLFYQTRDVLRSCPMWRRCAGVSIICIHHTVIDYVVIVLEHSPGRPQGGEQDYRVTK